jgi:hypothetical protein
MAVKTTLEQLEEVQAAITKVMTSQELSGPDSHIVRPKLADLLEAQKVLKAQYEAEQGTGRTPRVNVSVPKRFY